MKKSIIAFGILFSVITVNANTTADPIKENKIAHNTIKNLTPINIAVAKGDYDLVAKFLAYGSNSNEASEVMGMTPLMFAARYNNVKMLKLLMANSADHTATSKIGVTALGYAKLSNASAAVSYLASL